jgi:hypothetical protein
VPVVAELQLVWDLRDDVRALESLLPRPGLSLSIGMHPPAAASPVVGSPDWWEAIESTLEDTGLRGAITRVDPTRGYFEMRTDGGEMAKRMCRGGMDLYWEGSRIELVRSFPPAGYLQAGQRDPDGGLLVEVWTEE